MKPGDGWPKGFEMAEDEIVPTIEDSKNAIEDLRRAVQQRRIPLSVARKIAVVVRRLKLLERQAQAERS